MNHVELEQSSELIVEEDSGEARASIAYTLMTQHSEFGVLFLHEFEVKGTLTQGKWMPQSIQIIAKKVLIRDSQKAYLFYKLIPQLNSKNEIIGTTLAVQ